MKPKRRRIPIPQAQIADLCRRWKIRELALFGSALRDDFRPDSDVDLEGLRPGDYHLAKLELLQQEVRQNQLRKYSLNPGRLADLDLLCTDAFLIYGSHLLTGRINPETIDAEWFANRRETDLAAVLQSALDANQVDEALISLLPPQAGYTRMKRALQRYRLVAVDGGWPMIPQGPKLQNGDQGGRVIALKERLRDAGDLKPDSTDNLDIFDDALEQAVRRFQARHGLETDGVVGAATLASLNVPVEERIRQVILNMER